MMVGRLGLAPDHPVQMAVQGRLDRVMALIEVRLGEADRRVAKTVGVSPCRLVCGRAVL